MHKNHLYRIYLAAFMILIGMFGMLFRYYSLLDDDTAAQISVRQGNYHLHIPLQSGTIYDRNGKPLTNSENKLYAVVNPNAETVLPLFGKAADSAMLEKNLRRNSPFLCELTEEVPESGNLILLHGKENREGILPAQHLLGYCKEGRGIAGLQASYGDLLAGYAYSADITFTVSGNGSVLSGGEQRTVMNGEAGGGILTTLDYQIQRIADTALQNVKTGAAVIMDIRTGDLLAVSSVPVYNPAHLEAFLNDPDAPFLNRAFSAYSVGSVFKLVTAAAALENGIPENYYYDCKGAYLLYGQRFRCHLLSGHGLLDMKQAMTVSCNPYFISLSELLSANVLHDTASALGFGTAYTLAPDMTADSGYLPQNQELSIPAEKANFSFGQGKLTATPLQIAAMTACIANDGIYSAPRLIIGTTADGNTASHSDNPIQRRVLRHETASALQRMMIAVLRDSKHSNAVPCNIYAAGKTSTAQTGRTDADGKELCHAWMTGFFPAYQPQYAVTVLIENGGSGNDAAAPVFRRIIEEMRRAGY